MNTVSLYFDVVALTSYLCSVETWGCVRAHFACRMCFRSYLCIRSQGNNRNFLIFFVCFGWLFSFSLWCEQRSNQLPEIMWTNVLHPKHPQAFCMKSMLVVQKQESIYYRICNCKGAKCYTMNCFH